MINILLVENNKKIVRILSDIILSELDASIISSRSFEALNHLQLHDNIDLIVIRDQKDINKYDSVAIQVLKYLQNHKKNIPVLIIGDITDIEGEFYSIDDPFKGENLLKTLFEIINKSDSKRLQKIEIDEFVPISIDYFKAIDRSNCDIYIKIKKGKKIEYIKRINKSDSIDQDLVDRYILSGLDYLFVKKEDRYDFMDILLQEITSSLDKMNLNDVTGTINLLSESFTVSKKMLIENIASAPAKKIVDKTIGKMTDVISSNGKSGPMLTKIFSNEDGFLFKHSYFIATISYEIIKMMDWGSDKQFEGNFEKMIYVSFFHDALLNNELAKINSRLELYEKGLTEQDKTDVLEHANKAATLVLSMPHMPPGIDVIIRQHHGTANGIGFSDTYASSISGMAIVFIVLEEFALKVFGFDKRNDSMKSIFNGLYEKFHIPSYRKVVDALYEVVLKIGDKS